MWIANWTCSWRRFCCALLKYQRRPFRMRILIAEKSSFSENGLDAFSQIAPTDAFDLTQEQLVKKIVGYDILIVRLGLRVDKSVLAAGRDIRIIGTPTTGLDHIDLVTSEKRGIVVFSLKGERAFLDQVYATAEHTIALLLSLIRHVPSAFKAAKNYNWRRDLFRGTELNGKVLGIVGCGRLGSMVARYTAAFGMDVLGYDPYQPDLPIGVNRCENLAELLSSSDIVSIHVPLNQETCGMFSEREFNSMRPRAILINTSRGSILDESALLHALETGKLAGAALDVLDDEMQVNEHRNHPLIEYARSHENLIITPHIGGATYESVEKADLFIAQKIKEYLNIKG